MTKSSTENKVAAAAIGAAVGAPPGVVPAPPAGGPPVFSSGGAAKNTPVADKSATTAKPNPPVDPTTVQDPPLDETADSEKKAEPEADEEAQAPDKSDESEEGKKAGEDFASILSQYTEDTTKAARDNYGQGYDYAKSKISDLIGFATNTPTPKSAQTDIVDTQSAATKPAIAPQTSRTPTPEPTPSMGLGNKK